MAAQDTTLHNSYNNFIMQFIKSEEPDKYSMDIYEMYKKKVDSLFYNLDEQQITVFLDYITKTHGNIVFNEGTKYEGHKITIISDNYILRIFSNSEKNIVIKLYTLYNKIKKYNSKFIEKILEVDKINENIIYSVYEKYTPITTESIIKNNLEKQYVDNILNGLQDLKEIGYYHLDVSVDNSVWDGSNFRLIDFDQFKQVDDGTPLSTHIFRHSFEKMRSEQ